MDKYGCIITTDGYAFKPHMKKNIWYYNFT